MGVGAYSAQNKLESVSTSTDPDEPTAQAMQDLPGSLVIAADEETEISESYNGAIEVYGTLTIHGTVTGPLTVESLGRVTIAGAVDGSIEIRVAATVTILASGRVAGTIVNHGSVINHGWRSGRVEGRQPEDTEGSIVADPLPGIERYPSLPQA